MVDQTGAANRGVVLLERRNLQESIGTQHRQLVPGEFRWADCQACVWSLERQFHQCHGTTSVANSAPGLRSAGRTVSSHSYTPRHAKHRAIRKKVYVRTRGMRID